MHARVRLEHRVPLRCTSPLDAQVVVRAQRPTLPPLSPAECATAPQQTTAALLHAAIPGYRWLAKGFWLGRWVRARLWRILAHPGVASPPPARHALCRPHSTFALHSTIVRLYLLALPLGHCSPSLPPHSNDIRWAVSVQAGFFPFVGVRW